MAASLLAIRSGTAPTDHRVSDVIRARSRIHNGLLVTHVLRSSPPMDSSVSIALRAASRQLQPEPPLAQPVLTAATSTYRRWAQRARRVPPASNPARIEAHARTAGLENTATAADVWPALLARNQKRTSLDASNASCSDPLCTAPTASPALRAILALSRWQTAPHVRIALSSVRHTYRPPAARVRGALPATSRMRGFLGASVASLLMIRSGTAPTDHRA